MNFRLNLVLQRPNSVPATNVIEPLSVAGRGSFAFGAFAFAEDPRLPKGRGILSAAKKSPERGFLCPRKSYPKTRAFEMLPECGAMGNAGRA